MFEKSFKLQESMRMMGLFDSAYWLSYFIADGVVIGGILSFLGALLSTGGLFNGANFFTVFFLLFFFCLSAVSFNFFIAAFFDTPQTSGQAMIGVLLGFYVVYIACDSTITGNESLQQLGLFVGWYIGYSTTGETVYKVIV